MARFKYRNRKATYNGMEFDSRKEMHRYIQLKSMQDEGLISDLKTQVEYELIPSIWEDEAVQLKTKTKVVRKCVQKAVRYVADFVYKSKDGNEVVEDVKGVRTKDYILKKKMMRAFLGITINEV